MTDGMNTVLMFFGAITVVGAVIMALVQHNLKRLMSFHAVSQVGYMVMGIASGTLVGLAGGLFHMLNHAIYKSCLFLVAGVVEKEAGSVDLDRLGGLAKRLPLTFIACLIASLSISGIPPFNGFASKWMIYQGLIESGANSSNMTWVLWLAAAMLGSVLTLASFVKVLHAVFLCKPSPQVRSTPIRRAAWPAAVLDHHPGRPVHTVWCFRERYSAAIVHRSSRRRSRRRSRRVTLVDCPNHGAAVVNLPAGMARVWPHDASWEDP